MSIQIGSKAGGLTHIQLGLYPDNTPVVDLGGAYEDHQYSNNRYMILRPSSMQEFVTGMMIVESMEQRGAKIHDLVIPCIPGARQDKTKWEGDWLLTLRWVAKQINDAKFNRVVTVDTHSIATEALINNLRTCHFNMKHLKYARAMGDFSYDGVIAPDLGAVERGRSAAVDLGVPMHRAGKTRDPVTNKLTGFEIIDPLSEGAHYLVVDDLCDGGGTFNGLAGVIREQSATADLFVTHGVFSKGLSELSQNYGRVITTDSISTPQEGTIVIPLTEGLINA